MRIRPHRSRSADRPDTGAAAVEFALTVIPLLMIIGGIINFGLVFAQQLALDNAIRAGARAGVVDTGNNPIDVATNEFDQTAIAPGQVSPVAITFPGRDTCEDSELGDPLILRGEATATFLIPWPFPDSVLDSTIGLTSQAEFQCEYS